MIRVGFSTQKKNVFSRLIRRLTKSQVSHAWLLIDEAFLGLSMVMQATEGGWQLTDYRVFQSKNDVVCLIGPAVPLDSGVREAALWLGEHYDYTGLFGSIFVLLGRWLKRKWRNPLNVAHAMFCSEAVVYVLQSCEYPGSKELDPSATTPQDLLEFLSKS